MSIYWCILFSIIFYPFIIFFCLYSFAPSHFLSCFFTPHNIIYYNHSTSAHTSSSSVSQVIHRNGSTCRSQPKDCKNLCSSSPFKFPGFFFFFLWFPSANVARKFNDIGLYYLHDKLEFSLLPNIVFFFFL